MKNIIICGIFAVLLLLLQSCIVSSRPKQSFFDNPYYDNKDSKFVSVDVPMWIAKPIMKKVLLEDGGSLELLNLIKKVKDVKILTIENGNRRMLSDFTKHLAGNKFQDWITIKQNGQTVNFQAKQDGELIKKLMITVHSGQELVFIDIKGDFTLDDISRIINYSEKKDLKKLISK